MQSDTERALLIADSQARYERIEIHEDHLRFAAEEKDKYGLYIAAYPLSVERSYFEITIVDTGQYGAIGIGLVPYSYPLDTLPGENEHSVSYRTNFGKLYEGSSTGRKIGPICKIGDRLGCGINYTNVTQAKHDVQVVFTRNGCEICSVALSNTIDPLHPSVALLSSGEEVQLDLSAEWPIDRNEDSEWDGQLKDAIDHNDVYKVNQLLNEVAPVHTEETKTHTTLHTAAGRNLKQCVDFLLRNGADANLSDTHGWLPLHYAAKTGSLDCLESLLHFTRDINARDKEEWTALLFAANVASLECVAYILNHGGDVHVRNKKGETPLHRAALKGSLECVDILVRNGCNTKSSDNKNRTPLHMAAQSGSSACLEYVIQHGAQVNAMDDFGQTPLYHSTLCGSNEGNEVLLTNGADVNASDNDGWTPLHRAARNGNIEWVKLLLEHGADVNSSDDKGFSPLHQAAFNRNITLECVKLLIEHGAVVDSRTHEESTALHIAAQENSVNCLEKLIASGADINARKHQEVTALHLAAKLNSVECVEKLIASGADINTRTKKQGGTALHFAAQHNFINCLEYLIASGADINSRTNDGTTPLYLAVTNGAIKCAETLIANGAEVNSSANFGWTALHIAARTGYTECIEILIKAEAAVNSRLKNGATPLHCAVYNSWIHCTETLIAYGADVNSRANNGWTALHCAAKVGSIECITILIKAGADVNSRNDRNLSPSQTAAEEKHFDCFNHLHELESRSRVDEIEIAEEAQEVKVDDGGKEKRAKEAEDAFLRLLLNEKKKDSASVPEEILQDPYALNLYEKAIQDGIEYDRSIRINVVGNYGQGKTTLIRRLLDHDISGVESTNGIDVQQLTCMRSPEGKLTYKQETKKDDDILNRLLAVRIAEQVPPHTSPKYDIQRSKQDKPEKTVAKDNSQPGFTGIDQKDIKHEKSLPNNPVRQTMVQTKDLTTTVKYPKPDTRIQMKVLPTKHKQYFEKEAKKMEKEDRKRNDTLLKFWDFGGQFIFYATHSLFHSRQAIYLLVFDLSLQFNRFVTEEDCPIESGKRCVDYYLRFWINSIHSFVGTEDGKEPVVILVGTHKDKIPAQSSERKKYIKKYFHNVRELFDDTRVLNHIYKKDFSIDNNDANDPDLFALQEAILAIGEERSRSIAIPAKWIQLEKALDEIKDRKIVTIQAVFDIDDRTEFPIRDSEQIKLFLRYHHSKGALVFFDESPLSDYVILDPQFLIDAFKCIITSERFYNNDPEVRPMRRLLHSEARLEDSLIEYEWKSEKMFLENKTILLGFLEKHRIITQAREFDETKQEFTGLGWYIVTSLLKDHQHFREELKCFLHGKPRSRLQFVMEFKVSLVVELVFHRLIAAVAGKWPIAKHVVSERPKAMIYRNACVVLITDHAGIIEHNADSIRLAVVSCCPSVPVQSYEADWFRRFCEYVVQQEFRKLKTSDENQQKPYNLRFACNHEDHDGIGSKYYIDLNAKKRVRCPDLLSHDIDVDIAKCEWYIMDKFANIRLNLELNEKILSKLSQCIGENWELLAIQLGLTQAQIDHLKADNPTTRLRIYRMLLIWFTGSSVTKTLGNLVEAFTKLPQLTVDLDGIRNVADIQTDNEMASDVKTEREEITHYSVT